MGIEITRVLTKEQTKELVEQMLQLSKGVGNDSKKLTSKNVTLVLNRNEGALELTFVGSKRVKHDSDLITADETKKLIEEVTFLVNNRKKGQALDYVYTYVNNAIDVKVQDFVRNLDIGGQVYNLYRLIESLSATWKEMELEALTNEKFNGLKTTIEESSTNKISLKKLPKKDGKSRVIVVFTNDKLNRVVQGLIVKDLSVLFTGYNIVLRSELKDAIVRYNVKSLDKIVPTLTLEEVLHLSNAVDFMKNEVLGTYVKYRGQIEEYYNLIYQASLPDDRIRGL